MTAAPTPGARLEDRYGRTPRGRRRGRLAVVAAAAVLVLAAVMWAVATGFGGAANTTDLQTIGYTITSDSSVTIGWEVTGEASVPLVCAIEAQDANGSVLGLVEVRVPVTGDPARSGTTTVLTTRRADTGLIQSCRRA
ncbi:MAG TPA: DUF4307 domain-containing protein [Amnibacterium sp.]|nr:DUF4307 domain-containing protein [Amnibacterium sp.]